MKAQVLCAKRRLDSSVQREPELANLVEALVLERCKKAKIKIPKENQP